MDFNNGILLQFGWIKHDIGTSGYTVNLPISYKNIYSPLVSSNSSTGKRIINIQYINTSAFKAYQDSTSWAWYLCIGS